MNKTKHPLRRLTTHISTYGGTPSSPFTSQHRHTLTTATYSNENSICHFSRSIVFSIHRSIYFLHSLDVYLRWTRLIVYDTRAQIANGLCKDKDPIFVIPIHTEKYISSSSFSIYKLFIIAFKSTENIDANRQQQRSNRKKKIESLTKNQNIKSKHRILNGFALANDVVVVSWFVVTSFSLYCYFALWKIVT